jgi:hypothetical protein
LFPLEDIEIPDDDDDDVNEDDEAMNEGRERIAGIQKRDYLANLLRLINNSAIYFICK